MNSRNLPPGRSPGEKARKGRGRERLFKIKKISKNKIIFKYGKIEENAEDFFQEFSPEIWFADESKLFQNYYTVLREEIDFIPKDKILVDDWIGVDIKKEAQGIFPYL
jgi:hypothetical protein